MIVEKCNIMLVILGAINLEKMIFVNDLPAEGTTFVGNYESSRTGGKGAIQATTASKCGSEVYLFGAVGQDETGCGMLEELQSLGVNVSGVDIMEDKHSGVTYTIASTDGKYLSTNIPGTNFLTKASKVQSHFLHPDSVILLQTEVFAAENWKFLIRAKSRGAKIVLHASPRINIPKSILNDVDILIMSNIETKLLASNLGFEDDLSVEQIVRQISDCFNNTCITVFPSERILYTTHDEQTELQILTSWALDAPFITDVFVGAFAAHIDQHYSLQHSLMAGITAGAIISSKPRVLENIPTKRDLKSEK